MAPGAMAGPSKAGTFGSQSQRGLTQKVSKGQTHQAPRETRTGTIWVETAFLSLRPGTRLSGLTPGTGPTASLPAVEAPRDPAAGPIPQLFESLDSEFPTALSPGLGSK